jgi:hypothetical protein
MNADLHPDTESLRRFSAVLFKHADQRGFVSLRAFPHRANTSSIFIEPITLEDAQFLDVVCERARQAAKWREPAVFCPPVATFKTGKSAAEENIHEGVTLAAELDESPDAARARLGAWLGEPTLVMQSGGEWTNPETGEVEPKLHLHWRLKTPARTPTDLGKLKEARSMIVQLVGGDPTALGRLMAYQRRAAARNNHFGERKRNRPGRSPRRIEGRSRRSRHWWQW